MQVHALAARTIMGGDEQADDSSATCATGVGRPEIDVVIQLPVARG